MRGTGYGGTRPTELLHLVVQKFYYGRVAAVENYYYSFSDESKNAYDPELLKQLHA